MKHEKDIGLRHILKLGLQRQKSGRSLYAEAERRFGVSGKSFLDELVDIEGKNGQDATFYEKKDENYDLGMFISGAYDADIVRRACNWIDSHKQYFGKTILEIGCDCGFMTTFLAQEFPDSQIMSIDRNHNGIEIAKKNVEKFGLHNVVFMECDLSGVGERFDTVFSMRTAHENINFDDIKNTRGRIVDTAAYFCKESTDYAAMIENHIIKSGFLVSIERMEVDPVLLGWMEALNNNGISTNPDHIELLPIQEIDHDRQFPVIVGQASDAGIPLNDLYEKWKDLSGYDAQAYEWHVWNAVAAVDDKADKLMDGYYSINPRNREVMGKIAYYTIKGDDENFLFSVLINNPEWLTVTLPKEDESRIKETIEQFVSGNKRSGYEVTQIEK